MSIHAMILFYIYGYGFIYRNAFTYLDKSVSTYWNFVMIAMGIIMLAGSVLVWKMKDGYRIGKWIYIGIVLFYALEVGGAFITLSYKRAFLISIGNIGVLLYSFVMIKYLRETIK